MLSNGMWLLICLVLLILKYVILQPIEDAKTYRKNYDDEM